MDPAAFPKVAQYLSYSWNKEALARFDINVVRGCTVDGAVKEAFGSNPQMLNLIVPGRVTASTPCGNEAGFATTYGSGYRMQTLIGTLRSWSDSDQIHKLDGTPYADPTWGHFYLNMCSSGDDEKTAEWSARVKAHWALQNVGGSFAAKPWVHGVLTDNDLFWDMFNRNNSKGLQGSGQAWDDGLVRNHKRLREALGPQLLLGGNGAHWTASGIHDRVYLGSIPDGDSLYTDIGMYEEGANKVHWPEAWDHFMGVMPRWLDKKALDGRQRYGIFVVYGDRMGHTFGDRDQRLALAMSVLGGWHLWIMTTSSWSDTLIPGFAPAIPEMGFTSSHPHGWLGKPKTAALRAGLGLWKREFDGGIVYANSTPNPWVVDGKTVPAGDALFIKGAIPMPTPTPKDLITKSITEGRLNQFYYLRWQRDNPVESAKVLAYLDGGVRPTDLEVPTHYGKAFLYAEDARRSL